MATQRQGLATSDDEANARGIPSTTEWVARECITIEYIHARGGRCRMALDACCRWIRFVSCGQRADIKSSPAMSFTFH